MFRNFLSVSKGLLRWKMQPSSGLQITNGSVKQKVHRNQTLTLSSGQMLVTSRRDLLIPHQSLLPSTSIRLASTQMPNPSELVCNFLNMARCVDLNELKDCPPPTFWLTIGTAAAQLGIPVLQLFGGYSPVLTYLQLYMGATHLAFSAGQKWGLAMSNNPKPSPDWSAMTTALVPVTFAIVGLSVPYPVAFLTVAAGILTNFYIDLKSCWFLSCQVASLFVVSLSSVVGLLLACIAYVMFHNRENMRKENGNVKSENESGNQDEKKNE